MPLDDDIYSLDHGDRCVGRGRVAETVIGVVLLPVAVGMIAVGKVRDSRAAWRRWPLPATLGMLTNDEIDRLPARPRRMA